MFACFIMNEDVKRTFASDPTSALPLRHPTLRLINVCHCFFMEVRHVGSPPLAARRFHCPLANTRAEGRVASGGRRRVFSANTWLPPKTRERVPVTVHVLLRRHCRGRRGMAENKHPLTFPQSAAFNPSSCPSAAPHLQTRSATPYIIGTARPALPSPEFPE